MTELNVQTNKSSFKDFLLKNRRNRNTLLISTIAFLIQFSVFKYLYPFASYIHGDSFVYIESAYKNLDINTYMIGYSRFLRFFSAFTNSDTALTAFQYLFIQSSILFLLFTIFYFYKLGKISQICLITIMVINPLFLHLANLISSDCLFATLSLIWFSLLLWICHKPTNTIIALQALILFFAFTVRYNALIYPIITIIAYLFSPTQLRNKIYGLGMSFILCCLFITYTSYKYKLLTGQWQYSPFSGWQLANNALYAYRYVEANDRKAVPKNFKALDNMVREYFDSTRDTNKFPIEKIKASTFYMWSPKLTLFKYRNKLFSKDSTASELKKWASMGPFYKSYGLFIISSYPSNFIRHFILPNTIKYYAPPVEFLQKYNSGKQEVAPIAKSWFGYKTTYVSTRFKDKNVWILNYYPILSGTINIIMLFSLVAYFVLKGWKTNKSNKGIMLSGVVWFLNAVFTITASSAALRFQSFPIILTTTFSFILIDWLYRKTIIHPTPKSLTQEENVENNLSQSTIISI